MTLLPTCLVEYQATATGRAVVAVYERNGVACSLSSVECCGMPLLHSGAIAEFADVAERNVAALTDEIRRSGDLVAPEPACADTIARHYPDHVDPSLRAEAEFVAEHTSDAAEYLIRLHRKRADAASGGLDTDFTGDVPARVAYHPAGPVEACGVGFPARDLIELIGAHVEVVRQRSGIESAWAFRADHDDVAIRETDRLSAALDRVDQDVIVGDGHLSNEAIASRTGTRPVHPIRVIARAYGITEPPAD